MAAPIPPSWLANPRYLTSFEGTQFHWHEAAGDTAPGDIRLSDDQRSAADMIYLTTWDSVTTTQGDHNNEFFSTILGGYYKPFDRWLRPLVHPFLPGLFARDIVGISGIALTDESPDPSFQGYQVAAVKINFESLPYRVKLLPHDTAPFDLNRIEFRAHSSNMRLSTPKGQFEFAAGTPHPGKASLLGTYYNQAIIQFEIVIHRVPSTRLFVGGNEFDLQLTVPWGNDLGFINSDTVFGYPPETLLLDSIDLEGHGNWYYEDLKEYQVKMMIFYNSSKWNTAIDVQTGTWEQIQYAGTVKKPFTPISFADTFFLPMNG